MMDKKTILLVGGCVITLVVAQMVINKIYPPIPKKPKSTTTSTNAVPTNVVASATNDVETVKPALPEPEPERAEEQLVTLSNEYLRVTFTSWGGGVRMVELLKHRA